MGAVTFTQLGGPKRMLELAGYAAPFGRPRKGAVIEPEHRVRESEAYLPGSDEPVIHIFGLRREPIKMHGRFRDSKSGPGFALAQHEEVKQFVNDQQVCRVTWDDIYDIHGLVVRYTPKIESPAEIEWELEIKVLKDLLDAPAKPAIEVRGPGALVDQLLAALQLKDKLPYTPPTMRGSVTDALAQLVGTLNSSTAALVHASEEIDSFATATFASLRRLRGGLGQVRVAVNNVRNTYDNMLVSAALESESINQSQPFWDLQAAWAASSLDALRLIAQAEREAAKAERGRVLALHEAGEDETWESIATRWYGTSERADEIRDANGVQPGLEPTPGVVYFVPR